MFQITGRRKREGVRKGTRGEGKREGEREGEGKREGEVNLVCSLSPLSLLTQVGTFKSQTRHYNLYIVSVNPFVFPVLSFGDASPLLL